jgi:hypothetical protein
MQFSLENIDYENVVKKYIKDDDNENDVSNISELGNSETVSFMDESLQTHKCDISMIDFRTGSGIIKKYNCFWCKNPFSNIPIGCPIRYVHTNVTKKYCSEINGENYIIREDFSGETIKQNNIEVNKKNYYETDGVFCSFNCCYAWIKDNKHQNMYDNSETLLLKMYNEYSNTIDSVPIVAPHWRNLEEYGGNLTITEFRNSFSNMEIEYHDTIKNILPVYNAISHLYERKIKF